MPKLPFPVTHENYHGICVEWAYDVAKELSEVLDRNGVSGKKAEDIIGNFIFSLSMLYDGGGSYKVEGKYKPKLTFMNMVGELIVPEEDTHLHEYAHGIAGELFDEKET